MRTTIEVKNKFEKNYKKVKLDFSKINEERHKVEKMMNKNKVSDIFYDLEKTIAKKNIKNYLRYKYKMNYSMS